LFGIQKTTRNLKEIKMNAFVNTLNATPVAPLVARTLNGMRARATTSSTNLDLFGSIAAMRGKDVTSAFAAAYAEDKNLALRIAQWARDIRGGAGERKIFRDILIWLEANDPQVLVDSRILDNVADIGRFDDLLIFSRGDVKCKAFSIIQKALENGNGLCAKWMPRKGPIAIELREWFGWSPKQYRKTLVNLTKVVESQMCDKSWNEINFSHVPSVAMTRYMKAFYRNIPEAFEAYKAALVRNDGTAKVNASALYPYNVTKMVGTAADCSSTWNSRNPYKKNDVADAMWAALPDYMNNKNVIAVVDNSGSMAAQIKDSKVSCLDVAASLGIYTASNSKGAFRDLSISFSENASFVKQSGTLDQRMYQVTSQKWGSTNLHSVFDLILNHAIRHNVPAIDMPEMILILSDMQFNTCVRFDNSAIQMIRRKYEDAGYEVPQIVFWNLNDYGNKPVKFNDQGFALISGFSPAILESVLAVEMDKFTPEAVMLKTIFKSRYNW